MQNMFATMNVSNQPSQIKQDSSLDLLNSSSPNLVGQPVNASDYKTMQRLFATSSQNPTLFPSPGMGQTSNPIPSVGTTGDFNTMQNLFATGVPNQALPGFTLQQQPVGISPQLGSVSSPSTGSSDFYTIGNLFATGTPNQGINLTTSVNPPKTDNFNTMQNLYATGSQPPQNLNGFNQPIPNIQDVNLQDFNTMQNLFKTGSGIVLPPPTQAAQTSKQEDPFSVLGVAQPIETTQKV